MGKNLDLVNQRFGRLVVICENGRAKSGNVIWRCKCDCGAEVRVASNHLRDGTTQSCGCLRRERVSERSTTHGMTNHRLYRIWADMLRRTGVTKGASERLKRDYIDRGITVCNEWESFENFRDWSLSHGYFEGLQIDRIDNDRGYMPENCRFVSRKENANNRRCTIRLEDGTSLAMFCNAVGIQTCENGRKSKQYRRILDAYRIYHKPHPELLQKANETTALYKKTLEMLKLLSEVKQLKADVESLKRIIPQESVC